MSVLSPQFHGKGGFSQVSENLIPFPPFCIYLVQLSRYFIIFWKQLLLYLYMYVNSKAFFSFNTHFK
jgi:hypothetical protein